jgi:hypothetical protein
MLLSIITDKMNDTTLLEYSGNHSLDHLQTSPNESTNHVDITAAILNNYIGPILCLFGVCGNLLNLIILFKGNLNESPYTYLKTMAVTDMFALILSFIHMIISSKSSSYSWQFFNVYFFFPLVNFFMAASVWLTVGVTIDRFVYVKFPLWARGYCSVHRAKARIVFILLFTLLVTIPRFFCYVVETDGSKYTMKSTEFRSSSSYYYRIYDIACITLFHAAPLLIFMFCNAYLIYAVHQARSVRRENNIRNNKEKDWQKDQRRFTITLISIVLLSIIAILPSTIGDFTRWLNISFDNYQKLRHTSNILLLCNLSMNFLFYCAFNKRFVRVMKSVFCAKHFPLRSSERSGRSTKFSRIDTNATV